MKTGLLRKQGIYQGNSSFPARSQPSKTQTETVTPLPLMAAVKLGRLWPIRRGWAAKAKHGSQPSGRRTECFHSPSEVHKVA